MSFQQEPLYYGIGGFGKLFFSLLSCFQCLVCLLVLIVHLVRFDL
jgi:hypothetical protein